VVFGPGVFLDCLVCAALTVRAKAGKGHGHAVRPVHREDGFWSLVFWRVRIGSLSNTAPRGAIPGSYAWWTPDHVGMADGEGTTPRTKAPMCEMSASRYAPTSSAIVTEFLPIGKPTNRRSTGNDEFWFGLERQFADGVVIENAGHARQRRNARPGTICPERLTEEPMREVTAVAGG